jgi:hypothetical protein
MYWKKADKTICGVLSDYDLTVKLDRKYDGPSSKQRTGTRPFMARDLLEPTPREHFYRHDLESLFYVIVVLMFRFQDKTLKREDEKFDSFPALLNWFTLGPAALLEKKESFFQRDLPEASPAFERLYGPILKMRDMFADAYQARQRHKTATFTQSKNSVKPSFDESTLGGNLNFDKFQAILDSVQT